MHSFDMSFGFSGYSVTFVIKRLYYDVSNIYIDYFLLFLDLLEPLATQITVVSMAINVLISEKALVFTALFILGPW